MGASRVAEPPSLKPLPSSGKGTVRGLGCLTVVCHPTRATAPMLVKRVHAKFRGDWWTPDLHGMGAELKPSEALSSPRDSGVRVLPDQELERAMDRKPWGNETDTQNL